MRYKKLVWVMRENSRSPRDLTSSKQSNKLQRSYTVVIFWCQLPTLHLKTMNQLKFQYFRHNLNESIDYNTCMAAVWTIHDGIRWRRDDMKCLFLSMSSLHGSGLFNALSLFHCVSKWICITFDLIVLLCFFTTILVRSFNQSIVECGYCKLIRTAINERSTKSSEKQKIK